MDGLFYLFIFCLMFIFFVYRWAKKLPNTEAPTGENQEAVTKYSLYRYSRKESSLTTPEIEFYNKLNQIIGDKYIILPQAHLSTFLNHKVSGQNWRAAFNRINGKSIDFLICEKVSFHPVFGIELDDNSHSMPDRAERDNFVNEIMQDAGMLLVRFKAGEWSDERAIFEKVKNIATQTNLSELHK